MDFRVQRFYKATRLLHAMLINLCYRLFDKPKENFQSFINVPYYTRLMLRVSITLGVEELLHLTVVFLAQHGYFPMQLMCK
jgi:hypothetical protein